MPHGGAMKHEKGFKGLRARIQAKGLGIRPLNPRILESSNPVFNLRTRPEPL
jgi:hypothetical protein